MLAAMATPLTIGATLAGAQTYSGQTYYTPTPAVSVTPANMRSSIADLVEEVSPAVVNIVVRQSNGQVTSEGQGSGFIISPQGEVVTNYHVIDGGDQISVVFNNGTSFKAQIVGTDEETDLALLKISSNSPFPSVNFYKGSPIRIGDWVIAIGNPFGIGQSTSLGIISAIGRERVESGAYVDYIQTDATINRGNSGGPLFNPNGDVIGVNSAIFSPTGASVGIGFSIPHQTAENVINTLRQHGRVKRGWLGAGFRTAEYSRAGSKFNSGAIVNHIVAGGPAQQYGLEVDDVILQVNGVAVKNSVEAAREIGKVLPGQDITFMIERAEEHYTLKMPVTERPEKDVVERTRSGASGGVVAAPAPLPYRPQSSEPSAPPRPSNLSQTGLSIVDLSPDFRRAIGMSHAEIGVYIERVAPGSPAEGQGMKTNTVLMEANGKPVISVQNFRDVLAQAKRDKMSSIQLKVRAVKGGENYVTLPI